MITAIEIENFKGIGERVRVPLKPITLLFGANSSGKSTIVQALHYAREVFERGNLNVDRTDSGGKSVDLGGFQNILRNHDSNNELRLRFDVSLGSAGLTLYDDQFRLWVKYGTKKGAPKNKTDKPSDAWGTSILETARVCHSAWVEVSLIGAELGGREEVVLHVYRVGLNGVQIAKLGAEIEEIDFNHPILGGGIVPSGNDLVPGASGFVLRTPGAPYQPLRDLLSRIKLPLEVDRDLRSAVPPLDEVMSVNLGVDAPVETRISQAYALSTLISGPGRATRDSLRRLRYLGPLRVIPERTHLPPRLEETSRWPNGLGAWDALHRRDQEFVTEVNTWMSRLRCKYTVLLKDYVEVDQRILPAKEASADAWIELGNRLHEEPTKRRVVLVPDGQSIELSPADLGVGISQLLPAIVLALDAKDQMIAIEQPELHLHPKLQAELGDLFIESALGERKNTVILETHSEHLILRLLRRIRETTDGSLPQGVRPLRPDDVSVIYVESDDKGVKVSPLRIDETGEFIDRWPKGFFEEREDELF